MHWDAIWTAVRDVILTGFGMWVIYRQVYAPHPSAELIGAGLSLTAPSVVTHAARLVLTARPSSPSSPPPSPSPGSSTRPGAPGD